MSDAKPVRAKKAKPVPPQVGPKLPLKSMQAILEFLLKPDQLKVPGAWPREMKLLKQLYPLYPDEQFWLKIDFTFMLNSLAYFKTGEGAIALKRQWGLYRMTHPAPVAPPQFDLDNVPNHETMTESPVAPQNALDWASS